MNQTLEPNENYYNKKNEKLVIIINHEEFEIQKPKEEEVKPPNLKKRTGTQQDVKNLKSMCLKMKCNFAVFNDLKEDVIMKDVPEYVKRQNFDLIDGLIVFILTHGGTGDILFAQNNKYGLYDFINNFNSTRFPVMSIKPKLFFISACRGNYFQTTHSVNALSGEAKVDADSAQVDDLKPQQMYKNLLIAFGTYTNNIGMRNEISGTFFIQTLCKTFNDFIENTKTSKVDIMDILLKANKNLVQMTGEIINEETDIRTFEKQLALVYSSLTSPYVFNKSSDW